MAFQKAWRPLHPSAEWLGGRRASQHRPFQPAPGFASFIIHYKLPHRAARPAQTYRTHTNVQTHLSSSRFDCDAAPFSRVMHHLYFNGTAACDLFVFIKDLACFHLRIVKCPENLRIMTCPDARKT